MLRFLLNESIFNHYLLPLKIQLVTEQHSNWWHRSIPHQSCEVQFERQIDELFINIFRYEVEWKLRGCRKFHQIHSHQGNRWIQLWHEQWVKFVSLTRWIINSKSPTDFTINVVTIVTFKRLRLQILNFTATSLVHRFKVRINVWWKVSQLASLEF